METKFFAKFMDNFGSIVYISDGEIPFVFDIDQAFLFDTKDEAKCALSLVKAHERRGRFQKIGKRRIESETVENSKEDFYVFV